MPFTVSDFHDLLRLLEERPEWRADLRRLVLSDELLELPALVRQLVDAQARSDERLGGVESRLAGVESRLDRLEATVAKLAEAQVRTEERLDRLEATVARLAEAQARAGERLDRLEAAVTRLAEAQARAEERLARVEERQERDARRLEEHARRNALDFQPLKTDLLARRLTERPRMFYPFVAAPQPLTPTEADAFLGRLLDEGRLEVADLQDILWADLLVRGKRDDLEGYLVIEASWTIGLKDIERAVRRAAALRERAKVPAWAMVVGYRLSREAEQQLTRVDVLWLQLPESSEPDLNAA